MVSVAAPGKGGGSTVRRWQRALAAVVLVAGTLSACTIGSPSGDRSRDRDAALEVKLVSGTDGLDTQTR